MKKSTWNRTIPGLLLLALGAAGIANKGSGALIVIALLVGVALLVAGLLDKSPEKV